MAQQVNTMSNGEPKQLIVMNGKEKDGLREALPIEWTTPQHLGEVTIYNSKLSPPCCKIRTILMWYKVNYKIIEGKKPDSEYKKVPVLVIHNRQINDSYIMVISLAPILDGAQLSKEMIEIEEMTTYGLMMALELEVLESCTALVSCAPALGCCMGCVVASCACVICCVGPGRIRKANPDLKNLEYYSKAYTSALGAKQYFQGEKPGIIDVSICGVLAPFCHAGNKSVGKFLGSTGPLHEWYNRMKPNLPNIF